MTGITLSAQPIKDKISHGPAGVVHVVSMRAVPEHPAQASLGHGTLVNLSAPVPRCFGSRQAPSTPWSRLLYQCRIARAQNHEAITDAIEIVSARGFNALASV